MNVDMSPAAVSLRLKRVSQLRRLCLALGKAKVVTAMPLACSGEMPQLQPPEDGSRRSSAMTVILMDAIHHSDLVGHLPVAQRASLHG